MQVDDGYISKPELIEFPTASGETAYGFYYPPSNADFSAEGGAPPLLVKAHGGPTSQTSIVFNAALQFWTSRGFAVFLGEKLKTFSLVFWSGVEQICSSSCLRLFCSVVYDTKHFPKIATRLLAG